MAGALPHPTHEISHILLVHGEHFLVLKPLQEGGEKVVVAIDEILADHLYGVQDVEMRHAD